MPRDAVAPPDHVISELDTLATRSGSAGTTTTCSSDYKRRPRFKGLCCRCFKQRSIRRPKEGSSRHPNVSSSRNQSTSFIQHLLSPEYSSFRKGCWGVLVVTLTAVCLWQVGDRIKHYFDAPIMYHVTIERQHEVQFPAVTMCPAREPFNHSRWDQDNLWQDAANFSLTEIWGESEIVMNDSVFIYSACNEDQSRCNFDRGVKTNLNTSILSTYWGKCLTVLPGFPIEYRGVATFMEIELRPGPYNKNRLGRDVAAQFFFQESNDKPRHEAYYLAEHWGLKHDTIVRLSLKQFNFLNTATNPCDDEAAVTECKNKCVDKMLDRTVNCSLPFMISKLPACGTPQEAKLTMDKCRQFYQTFSYAHCPCRRPCIQKMYSYILDSTNKGNEDLTILILQFVDNLMENVKESYAYSFSALVSDVGGGLGFFLGVSILSSFEAFVAVLDKFSSKTDKEDE